MRIGHKRVDVPVKGRASVESLLQLWNTRVEGPSPPVFGSASAMDVSETILATPPLELKLVILPIVSTEHLIPERAAL
jgi:hypothetical protein